MRLGDLLRDRGIDDYALIMDIEGAEAGLLEHDASALAGCRQILAELHDTPAASRADLRDRIGSLGFTVEASYGSVAVFGR